MAAETKTANDLRNIHERLKNDMVRFEVYLDERLYQLTTMHPVAVITQQKGIDIKAKSISNKNQISLFTIEQKFNYIEAIETYILSQNKYVQGKLF